jgi:hypothetical protein
MAHAARSDPAAGRSTELKTRPEVLRKVLARTLQVGEPPRELCLDCDAFEGIRHSRATRHFTVRPNPAELQAVVEQIEAMGLTEQVKRLAETQKAIEGILGERVPLRLVPKD